MHYEVHDSSGTPLLLLHGGLFDIHQQFGELLPGKLRRPANHRGGRLKPDLGHDLARIQVGGALICGFARWLGRNLRTNRGLVGCGWWPMCAR